jgi:hypothetical protein
MRQVIRDTFFDFTAQREGFTPFLYADVLNLVTTGIGNLVDAGPNHDPPGSTTAERARLNNVVSAAAMAPAMSLPWKLRGPGWTSKNPVAGALATPAEIADAWTRVKEQNVVSPDFSQRGGFAYAGLTNITLDLDEIKALFNRTLVSFDATLARRFPEWETWPADAQLAILSLSWANGPGFHFPAMVTALQNRDFDTAATDSFYKLGGGTQASPQGRNLVHQIALHNAAMVERTGADPDRLIFPGTSGPLVVASSPMTLGGVRVDLAHVALAAAGVSVAILGYQALSKTAFGRTLNRKIGVA